MHGVWWCDALFLLFQAARDYGYTLLSRSPHQCSLSTPDGTIVEYDVLHMLEFDSNRKCMSIIVREKGQSEVVLYSKGADSVIYRNLKKTIAPLGLDRRSHASLPNKNSRVGVGSICTSKSVPDSRLSVSAIGDGGSGVDGGSGLDGNASGRWGAVASQVSDFSAGSGLDISVSDFSEHRLDVSLSDPSRHRPNEEGAGSMLSPDIIGSRSRPNHIVEDKTDDGENSTVMSDSDSRQRRMTEEVFMRDKTQSHLDDYAKLGLRTLCVAKRVSCEGRGGEQDSNLSLCPP